MAEKLQIDDPVVVEQDSSARVAFDLMNRIAAYDPTPADKRNADWWLKLYDRCWKAVSGQSAA